MRFPQIFGKNLNGKQFEIPQNFQASLNILLLAFKYGQGAVIREWLPFLDNLTKGNPDLTWYELPTLSVSYLPNRPNIDGGMRGAIVDPDIRERTITLYVNKLEFMKQLNISTDETITILLVQKDGKVLWQTENGFEQDKLDELKNIIKHHK